MQFHKAWGSQTLRPAQTAPTETLALVDMVQSPEQVAGAKPGPKPKPKPKPKPAVPKPKAAPAASVQANRFLSSLSKDIAKAARLSHDLQSVVWGEGIRSAIEVHQAAMAQHQQSLTTLVANPATTEEEFITAVQDCTAVVTAFHNDAARALRLLQPAKAKAKAKASAKPKAPEV